MDKIFIANPSYNKATQNITAQLNAHASASAKRMLYNYQITSSVLTASFNNAWVHALNLKEAEGLTHFLLWHADVAPIEPNWLDLLLDAQREANADVLGTIIPIKDPRGLTSTAIDTDFWRPRRITLQEAHDMDKTWSAKELLVNTGLMLVDFTKDWVNDITFHINDCNRRNAEGKWETVCEPEDWNFSRQCHSKGLTLAVTRAVTVNHFGHTIYSSAEPWGWDHDLDYASRIENVQL